MIDRVKHNAGFTLAELLLSIAIIMVLAAIAIPSIVTAQNNMRMVELNNAAQSIANAAQTQMTAMKVSGTWLALVEDADGKVQYPASSTSTDTDTYYMVADSSGTLKGARDNGVVPGLSIDDTVRRGDFVIVFKASTASVVEVFYTDGKTGFFGEAPESTNAAQSYYADGSGNTAQAARMANDPMIGYYQGTPAGATDAVALRNPVIWISEEGMLCIQDANLTGDAVRETSTEVTITLKGTSTAFKIAGLGGDASSYTVSTDDDKNAVGYLNSGKKAIYEITSKSSLGEGNVYSIDLNELARILQADTNAKILADIINQFTPAADIQLDVEVKALNSDSVHAKAKAFAQWPSKVAMLKVYVTNPAIEADENGKVTTAHIQGTYKDPVCALVDSDGNLADPSIVKMEEEEKIFSVNSETPALVTENAEAGRQSYSGGSVTLQKAYDTKANVKITSGSYTANGTGVATGSNMGTVTSTNQTHQYQIYEIWINDQRVGYINQGKWVWEGDLGEKFREVISFTDDVSDLTSLTIDTHALYEKIEATDKGYSIYVRTTPRSSEVDTYFSGMASKLGSYLSWNNNGQGEKAYGTTGSRGINRGAPVRKPFENEFGASSTVALWNMTTSYENKYTFETSNGQRFPWYSDLRIYYSATPAVAWGENDLSQYTIYNALPSAILWLYDKKDASYVKQPQAYVRDARNGSAANLKLVKSYDSGTGLVAADFEIEYSKDYLFYRVLEYCDQDGKPIKGIDLQYVPHTVQDEANYATIADAPAKEGFRFVGWEVSGESAWPKNTTFTMEANSKVSNYDDKLGYGYVKLVAKYEELPKGAGLMYLEFDSAGEAGGKGYLGDGTTWVSKPLSDEAKISSWGYYVLVPDVDDYRGKAPSFVGNSNSLATLSNSPQEVTIGGTDYLAYKLTGKGNAGLSAHVVQIDLKLNKVDTTFFINFNFANAVANSAEAASKWGKSEETAWEVRHADQFPGCLSTNYGVPVVQSYREDCFEQSRDIDMTQRTGTTQNYRDTVFSGVYDGMGHSIYNAHVNASGSVRSNSSIPRGASFLFLEVAGSDEKRAILKNIQIKEDPATLDAGTFVWDWKTDDSKTYIGLLAGTISKCDVTNCSISGYSDDLNTKTTIEIDHNNSGVSGWGVLIGRAYDSTITGSYSEENPEEINPMVEGITLSTSSSKADAWSSGVGLGIIVGQAENVTLKICAAKNASIGTTLPCKSNVYAGGLIGDYIGSLNVDSIKVENITLTVPVDQKYGTNLFVGNFVGREPAAGMVSGGTYSNVLLKQGTAATLVDDLKTPPETERSVDSEIEEARKEETEPAESENSVAEEVAEQEPHEPSDFEKDVDDVLPPLKNIVRQNDLPE